MKNNEYGFYKNLLSRCVKIKRRYFAYQVQRNMHEVKDTKNIYTNHSKKYTKERHSLHKKIVELIEKPSTSPKPGKKPVAILIGGGTASGKTTMRQMIIEKELIARNIYTTTVDLDEIKEYIPEYAVYKKNNPSQAASLVHKESCDIGALLLNKLIKNRNNFIYEGTMAKTRKYKWLVKELKNHNYEIHAFVVDVPLSVAKERANERARISGRIVPDHIIENTHKLVPRTLETIKDLLDSYQVYDNQNGLTLIASNCFVAPQKYDEFLKKGKIKYRLLSMTKEIRNMFNIPQNFNGSGIANKKKYEVFIDDCYDFDILDRKYPN